MEKSITNRLDVAINELKYAFDCENLVEAEKVASIVVNNIFGAAVDEAVRRIAEATQETPPASAADPRDATIAMLLAACQMAYSTLMGPNCCGSTIGVIKTVNHLKEVIAKARGDHS